jgi:prolyl-tRNA synthetase
MGHGDANGLRVPPNLAPVQVVVLLVRGEDGAAERAAAVTSELRAAGVRADLDDRVDINFGRRAVEWELKGVPVRVEIGPRDLAAGTATVARRDSGAKDAVPLGGIQAKVTMTLTEVQAALQADARERRESRTADVDNAEEATEAARAGFARIPWDTIREEEEKLAHDGVTVRCLQRDDGSIPDSSSEPGLIAFVSRAY